MGKKKEREKESLCYYQCTKFFLPFFFSWIGNSSPLMALLHVADWCKYVCCPVSVAVLPLDRWKLQTCWVREPSWGLQGFGARSGNAHALIATRRHFPYFYWMCLMSWSELSCSDIQEGEKWFVCSPPPPVVHIHGLALLPSTSAQFKASWIDSGPVELGWWCVPSPPPENPNLPACSNSWCIQWAQGPAVLWQQFNKCGWSMQMGVARNAASVCASSCNGVEKPKEDKAIRLLFPML